MMRHRPKETDNPMRRTAGFTLVEIVAALALAGLLLTVLLTVTGRVNHTRARLDDAARDDRDRADGLVALLRHDLIHARSVESVGADAIITGYGGLDRRTLEPTHRPARVTYRVLDVGVDEAMPVLVREQIDLDNQTNREASIELVAIGIGRFAVKEVGHSDDTLDSDAEIDVTAVPSRWFEASWHWADEPDREMSITIDRG